MRLLVGFMLLACAHAQIRSSSLRKNLTEANEMISNLNSQLLRIEQENERLKTSMDEIKEELYTCQEGSDGKTEYELPKATDNFEKDFVVLKNQMEEIQQQVQNMYRKIKSIHSSDAEVSPQVLEDSEADSCEAIINSYGLLKMHKGYFLFSDQMKNWTDAKKYCKGYNLELAKIDDAATNTAIGNYISSKGQKNWEYYWLGGRKNPNSAIFYWMTGPRQQGLKYSAWKVNEPDQSGDCILTYADGLWVDGDCASSYRTLCQLHKPDCNEKEPEQLENTRTP